ncbi:MAG: response regulator transcription factor [bacterium]
MTARSKDPGTALAPTCRIMVVDDHPLMREGLSLLIQSEKDLVICGQAEDAADAMRKMEADVPDVAVIDILLPGSTNGIELTKALLATHPEVKVLILSMHDDAIYVERAFSAGARGYVTKAEVSRVILDAIRTVLAGRTYVSQRVSVPPLARIEQTSGSQKGWGVVTLTDREMELLELLGRGFSRSQIAERLHLSVKTVEAHRFNIRTKLGLKSSSELMRYALKWVERSPRR